MTNKSWPIWLVGAALLALTLALGVWLLRPTKFQASYQRLREGMTLQEVEAIMGGPPHEEHKWYSHEDTPDGPREIRVPMKHWNDEGGETVIASFDAAGRLTYKHIWRPQPIYER